MSRALYEIRGNQTVSKISRDFYSGKSGRLGLLRGPVYAFCKVAGDIVSCRDWKEAWILGNAAFRVAQPLPQPASGVKSASGRRAGRAWGITTEDDASPSLLDLRIGDRYGGE
jgi:hypothetical protein